MKKVISDTLQKKLKLGGIGLALAAAIAAPVSYADNAASASVGGMTGPEAQQAGAECNGDFCKVLSTELKNSGTPKDLVIGVSFETVLFTDTSVRSKGGNKSESMAEAEILMKVLVDGVEANPGEVVFDRRTQTLWARLGGGLDCTDSLTVDTDGDGQPDSGDGIITFDECELTEEEIGLILDTTQASTFNFLANNIGSGSHTIEVWAAVSILGAVDGDGATDASASLGKGTLSVWEVHGFNGTEQ